MRRYSIWITIFGVCCSICAVLGLRSPVSVAYAESTCSVPDAWLPTTPVPTNETPPPHPAPDCPFYRAAWQAFLYVTQPDMDGRPRFLSDPTIADTAAVPQFAKAQTGMLSLALRIAQFPNEKLLHTNGHAPGLDAGVNQAGPLRGLLIDQNGNPIYYAIHVNSVYADFIKQNNLKTKDALLNADAEKLQFGEGAVELESAWQIVDAHTPPSNYFTTMELVPNLRIQNGDLIVDNTSREVTVALIAIHVVFVLKDHPEFVWSTFEHLSADGQGIRDNAPVAPANPSTVTPSTVISTSSWLLFKAGTTVSAANLPNSPQDRINSFDEKAQRFAKGNSVLQTSVYRVFQASKSTDTNEDEDVVAVNASMRRLFTATHLDPKDKRRDYQLVGAIWLDNPSRDFRSNVLFQNQPGQSPDDAGAMVAGEDRLPSTAMESFTQSDDGRPNCFSCHNTKRVTNDLTGQTIVPSKRLKSVTLFPSF